MYVPKLFILDRKDEKPLSNNILRDEGHGWSQKVKVRVCPVRTRKRVVRVGKAI